tara:strand:+ start:711 stop:953 length:243 start_codon:yes stop_codon:yes gene_type:complete
MAIGDLVTLKKPTQMKLWSEGEAPELGIGVIIDSYEAEMTLTTYYKVQFTGQWTGPDGFGIAESGWFEDFELKLISESLK